MSPLTLDQVRALGVRERCDYLLALPREQRITCLRALAPEQQALYLGELARRNLEERRRAALAELTEGA